MLRVCSSRGVTATSILWRKKREESRQVAFFSESGVHQAIIGSITTSARHDFITIAAKIELRAISTLPAAQFLFLRALGMRKSLQQPGGAQ